MDRKKFKVDCIYENKTAVRKARTDLPKGNLCLNKLLDSLGVD